MATTGLNWVLGRYSGASPYAIGGKLASVPSIEKHGENTLTPGTGSRQADLDSTNIFWSLDFKSKMQILTTYFNAYAMITAEGALPSHSLYTYDGITKRGFTGCLVDKASLEINQTGPIIGSYNVIATGNEDKDLTITQDTEAVMTKAALTTLTVGGVSKLTKFTSVRMAVDNHVAKQASGTGHSITDAYAKHASYEIDIEIVKTAALTYGYDTTRQATVVLALTDNQGTPVTKTYTFANMAVRSNAYRVDELGLTFEKINGEGNSVVIT
jgi:hypothetical protein